MPPCIPGQGALVSLLQGGTGNGRSEGTALQSPESLAGEGKRVDHVGRVRYRPRGSAISAERASLRNGWLNAAVATGYGRNVRGQYLAREAYPGLGTVMRIYLAPASLMPG